MVGRFERGEIANPPIVFLGAFCEVVGLEFGMRAYPTGDPIRDRAQLALLERLRVRIAPSLRWRTEVPLPIEPDRRAWDAEIAGRVRPRGAFGSKPRRTSRTDRRWSDVWPSRSATMGSGT
jgi:hypothetical protein